MGSIHYSAIPVMGIAAVIALMSPEVVTLLSLPITPEIIPCLGCGAPDGSGVSMLRKSPSERPRLLQL